MIEFIIWTGVLFAGAFLSFTAVEYYVSKRSLKESVVNGLFPGIFLTAMLTAFQYRSDYKLIAIGSALGIITFLSTIVLRYHVYTLSLKDSIGEGLIVGIVFTILFLILAKSIDFLFDLIETWTKKIQIKIGG